MDVKELGVGIGILLTGGTTAALLYFGSILLLPDSNNQSLAETIEQIQNEGLGSLIQSNERQEEPINSAEKQDNISLSEAQQIALDFIGEGEVNGIIESSNFGVAWEVTVELSDGSTQIVEISDSGEAQIKSQNP